MCQHLYCFFGFDLVLSFTAQSTLIRSSWLVNLTQLTLVAQSGLRLTGDQKVAGSTPAGCDNIHFVEIYHEIFSTVILSILLIQEGHLSDSGKKMSKALVNH